MHDIGTVSSVRIYAQAQNYAPAIRCPLAKKNE